MPVNRLCTDSGAYSTGLGSAFNRIRGVFNRLYVRWKELRGVVDRMLDPSYIGPTGPPVHPVGLVRLGVPDV